jgi:hypothetical protein
MPIVLASEAGDLSLDGAAEESLVSSTHSDADGAAGDQVSEPGAPEISSEAPPEAAAETTAS